MKIILEIDEKQNPEDYERLERMIKADSAIDVIQKIINYISTQLDDGTKMSAVEKLTYKEIMALVEEEVINSNLNEYIFLKKIS